MYVSSEDPSFSWTNYARDVYELGYDPADAKLVEETGHRLKNIYETRLKPLQLDATFETFRTHFVEETLNQNDGVDSRIPKSDLDKGSPKKNKSKKRKKRGTLVLNPCNRLTFEMSFESLRHICVCVLFRFANEESIQRL